MGTNISNSLCLIICCFIILCTNGIPIVAYSTDMNNNSIKNIFLHRYMFNPVPDNLDSNSMEDLSSIPSIDIQRRNVLMPRLCYLSRVTKSGVYRKLCLPYNN